MIQVILDNVVYTGELIRFSDGCSSVRFKEEFPKEAKFGSATVTDAQGDSFYNIITQINALLPKNGTYALNIPYLPYARADRAFSTGMANPLELFVSFLEGTKFSTIYVEDVHNPLAIKTYKLRFMNKPKLSVLIDEAKGNPKLKELLRTCTLCFPDKGAAREAKDIHHFYQRPYVVLDKVRNPDNGYITSMTVKEKSSLAPLGHVLILDDICDGGKTFELAAEALRLAGALSVSLYVTHGIFSKGPVQGIDNTFTRNKLCFN